MITPPIAPEPYSAAIGPRTTSIRSMSDSVSIPKLNASVGSEASFIGIPSRSTRTWLELVPRMKTLAMPPCGPDGLTCTPGHIAQRLRQAVVAMCLDRRSVDDRDPGWNLLHDRRWHARRSHNRFRYLQCQIIGFRRRNGQCRQGRGEVACADMGACGYSIDQCVDCPPTGFSPSHRFTSPDARAQSRCRPVSWLAGLGLWSAFSPPRGNNGIWTRLAAYSCEGSRLSAVPVSALAGHRHLPATIARSCAGGQFSRRSAASAGRWPRPAPPAVCRRRSGRSAAARRARRRRPRPGSR